MTTPADRSAAPLPAFTPLDSSGSDAALPGSVLLAGGGSAGHVSPLQHTPFDPMAAVLHLAAWRARAEASQLTEAEMVATVPEAVTARLGITTDLLVHKMPPLSELAAGLEAMID